MYKIDDRVTWDERQYNGLPPKPLLGTILAFYKESFPIILLNEPDRDGNKAKVVHDSVLKLLDK
jgi:hypothetical protein